MGGANQGPGFAAFLVSEVAGGDAGGLFHGECSCEVRVVVDKWR